MTKKIEDMSVKELRVEAKEKGFKGVAKLSKGLLLEALGYVAPETATPPPPPKASPVSQPTKQKRTRRAPTKETVGEIENGVPVPSTETKGKYPLEALKSGESFLVGCPPKDAKKIRLNIMNAARRITKKTGATFLVQVRSEEKGVRCWRTDVSIAQVKSSPKKAEEKSILFTDDVTTLGVCSSEANSREPEIPGPAPVAPPQIPSTGFKLFADE